MREAATRSSPTSSAETMTMVARLPISIGVGRLRWAFRKELVEPNAPLSMRWPRETARIAIGRACTTNIVLGADGEQLARDAR